MEHEILQEKLAKLEREINRYISEREKVEAKMSNLEVKKNEILGGFEAKSAETLALSSKQSQKQRYQSFDPKTILNTLETAKVKLENLDQNLNKTFQTIDDVICLCSTIYNYRGMIGKILSSVNSITDSNASGSSKPNNSLGTLGELTKLPIVRNLAKELLGRDAQR